MDVKDAVRLAKAYIGDVFADEKISDVGLDETDFDETQGRWLITIGFGRPYDRKLRKQANPANPIASPLRPNFSLEYENRWFKSVQIDSKSLNGNEFSIFKGLRFGHFHRNFRHSLEAPAFRIQTPNSPNLSHL